ncbi:MAG: flagellar protein FlaG [Proteobacteria bacterium]|nr:flagellar protein FlaG [Pseudomonadota bacterium]
MSVPSLNSVVQPTALASNQVRENAQASASGLPKVDKGSGALHLAKDGVVPGQTKTQDANAPDQAKIKDAAASVEKFIKSQSNTQIEFSVDDATHLSVIKVVDSVSQEVLMQIPSKEIIALAQAIDKLQGLMSMKGMLLSNRKA